MKIKKKKRTAEEIRFLEIKNKNLAAEYKLANPNRRGEILEEYWGDNEYFLTYWGRWDRQDWPELTQIFASYLHEAFMLYRPESEKSVFNFYMDRVYKSKAAADYKRWITKERNMTHLELPPPGTGDRQDMGTCRRELFIHPQSEYDHALLRSKLSRNLDEGERYIMDEYFYGDKSLPEVVRHGFYGKKLGFTPRSRFKGVPMKAGGAGIAFKRAHESLLNKLCRSEFREELHAVIRQRDSETPPKYEKLYMDARRREMFGLEKAA